MRLKPLLIVTDLQTVDNGAVQNYMIPIWVEVFKMCSHQLLYNDRGPSIGTEQTRDSCCTLADHYFGDQVVVVVVIQLYSKKCQTQIGELSYKRISSRSIAAGDVNKSTCLSFFCRVVSR